MSKHQPKRILLTGAAGFIGSHTADRLLERGDFVVGLDNLNDYYSVDRKKQNIREVQEAGHPGTFEFVVGDIRDRETVNGLFAKHDFDAVVHLAAMAGVRASVEDPWLYNEVNLTGSLNLFEASKNYGKPNIAMASTSSVYGRTDVVPFVETDTADRPLAPYPASKRSAELLGFSYHHLHGLDINALRFFTVYGPRGRPDMMAYKVLDNIFHGKEVPLYNGGQMHRDWTYVDDITAGIAAAADKRLGFEAINLGRGEPTLLADFVKLIEELAGKPSQLKSEPMMAADISYTYANVDKARKLLGYEPTVSVKDGVQRFFDWYKEAALGAG